jgi:hypothetical protein
MDADLVLIVNELERRIVVERIIGNLILSVAGAFHVTNFGIADGRWSPLR